ncbi:hypothetical protein [Polaromonas naphthalenivorans]|uniref:Uncharacterized protein n=1 Tax=Polaromonas naphthalenivorans (strain CJ2) TaxID=365044 RepID=A1VPJ1_POLNA|nr:hypothetical protein [Polaromonas naphthalenivorans]ABM37569.1 hypothetical protein Pnap_2261 [Polaromonas naphthalenivorans CJ2]
MAVLDTSAQALIDLGEVVLNKLQGEIFDLVLAHRRRGIADMTGAEIRDAWEVVHAPARLEKGTVSGRVRELITMGRLVRSPNKRECRGVKGDNAKVSGARPVSIAPEFIGEGK